MQQNQSQRLVARSTRPLPKRGAKRRSEDLCYGKRIRNNTKGGSAVLEKGREAERERLVYLMVYIDKNLTKFW